jgi:hypothetical protein
MPLKKGHKGKRTISEMQADPDFCMQENGPGDASITFNILVLADFFRNFIHFQGQPVGDGEKNVRRPCQRSRVVLELPDQRLHILLIRGLNDTLDA